jgi:hypothetical protein
MFKLRATVADLQLRQRPERAGRAATESQHGSVRARIHGIERTSVSRTVVGVGIGVRVRI